jgi:hypothetical protein
MTKTPTPMQKTTGAEDVSDRVSVDTRDEADVQYLGGKEVISAAYTDDTEASVRVQYVDGSAETLPADSPALEELDIEAAPEVSGETLDAETGEPIEDSPAPEPTTDAVTGEVVEGTGPTATKDVTRGGDAEMNRKAHEDDDRR